MVEAAKKPAWTWDFLSTPAYKYGNKNDRRNSGGTLRQKETKGEKREKKREKEREERKRMRKKKQRENGRKSEKK